MTDEVERPENVQRLALFIDTSSHYNQRPTACSDWADDLDTYTRVSEYVEVEFPMRDAQEYIPEQIAALQKRRDEIREEAEGKVKKIEERIANLAALEHKA